MAKARVVKTRNGGTRTEAKFWGSIRSSLRKLSMYRTPITQARNNVRRAYKGVKKNQKYEYQCKTCSNWYDAKNIEVNHIVPAGSLKCYDDLPGFVERLFAEEGGYEVLCKKCHLSVTKSQKC